MRDGVIVINTTPLIALSAAGCMDALGALYQQVVVPREVADEMRAGTLRAVGIRELSDTRCLDIQTDHTDIPAYLSHVLDRGEAAVIATALARRISVVCIDETVGRRIARLAGLELTGSIGILIKAKSNGFPVSLRTAIQRMRDHGIWLSATVVDAALAAANED